MKHLKLLGITALIFGFTTLAVVAPDFEPNGVSTATAFTLAAASQNSLSSPAAPDLDEPQLQLAPACWPDRWRNHAPRAVLPGTLARLILLASGLLALMWCGGKRKKS